MMSQNSHYPTVTIVTDHKTQFFTHFSQTNLNKILFQRVTNDTSFGYFHVWEKYGLNGFMYEMCKEKLYNN